MRVSIRPTAEDAASETARQIADLIRTKPDAVLGLATGGTMEPVYRALIEAHRAGLSLARVTTFNLDEYLGLGPDHPNSYRAYMRRHLFDHVDIDPAAAHLPDGAATDPEVVAARYEALIARLGPIDLQLLGLGRNGHIGFNEPTSSLGSRTRVKRLMRSTREANSRYFPSLAETPTLSITMGIATILEARRIVTLAVGSHKTAPVAAMVEGPIGGVCPGSALQMHPDTQVVLDEAAAADLRYTDYYRSAEEQDA